MALGIGGVWAPPFWLALRLACLILRMQAFCTLIVLVIPAQACTRLTQSGRSAHPPRPAATVLGPGVHVCSLIPTRLLCLQRPDAGLKEHGGHLQTAAAAEHMPLVHPRLTPPPPPPPPAAPRRSSTGCGAWTRLTTSMGCVIP